MFDAYTVKKVLPKLVIAVILMQISWDLAVWAIHIANDIGQGVSDLMYAPFGGANNMSLQDLLGRLGGAVPGLTVGGIFVTLILANSVGGLTLIGIGLIALAVLLGILVGLLVLIFRQVLIILCVILMPFALVLWILPGTQRYWKLWYDNFSKLLILFPIIMAIIAAGRIFAYITAGAASGSTGDAIIAIFGVLGGYFGPYFLLPRAFKWGGTAMTAVTSTAGSLTRGARQAPRRYATGLMQANRQQRAQDRNLRLAEGTSQHPRWDTLMAGGYNAALTRRARERRFQANRAAGRKAAEEATVESIVGSEYENLDHPFKIDTLRTVAQGQHDARTGIDGTNNPTSQKWAMDELAKYGDWDIIANLRDRNQVDERTWQAFVAKNIGAIHQNAPHLSPQRTDLSQQSVEDRINYKDFEQTELAEQAIQGYTRDALTGAEVHLTGEARTQQAIRHLAGAQTALSDSQIRRRLSAHAIAENERIRDTLSAQINTPTVRVVPGSGGRPPTIILPNNLSTDEAQESITQVLSERDVRGRPTNDATRVGQQFAQRVAEADHTAPGGLQDEQAFVQYLSNLTAQNSTTSLAMRSQLENQLRSSLQEHITETERSATEAGSSETEIQRVVAEARTHEANKLANLGL